jgi:hypothetical protein
VHHLKVHANVFLMFIFRKMYAVVTTFHGHVRKVIPAKWLINVNKKVFIKTNTYVTYYCSNIFEEPVFTAQYKTSFNETEGIYKVYILAFCGEFLFQATCQYLFYCLMIQSLQIFLSFVLFGIIRLQESPKVL